MRKVGIITDSNSGVKPDQARDMGISVVPMPFIIGEETYYEEISLTRKEFFQRMEVLDMIAYLRVIAFGDDVSTKRIINKPRRRFGRVKLVALEEPR